jgi:hypothetical protein
VAARLTEAEIEAIARRIVSDLDGKPAAASAAASGGASPAGAPWGSTRP